MFEISSFEFSEIIIPARENGVISRRDFDADKKINPETQ